MLTDAQRAELSDALYNALLRRLKYESEASGALIDTADLSRLVAMLLEL